MELLVSEWSLTDNFRDYLTGSKFLVLTNYDSSTNLPQEKMVAVKQRWTIDFTRFGFMLRLQSSYGEWKRQLVIIKSNRLESESEGSLSKVMGHAVDITAGNSEVMALEVDITTE